LLGAETDQILARLRGVPEVRVAPHINTANVSRPRAEPWQKPGTTWNCDFFFLLAEVESASRAATSQKYVTRVSLQEKVD
jgi:hypothetical protein